jgi:TolA-binding protein
LIKCKQCGQSFQVNGANGKYLGCPYYKRGACTHKTRLPRRLAEKLILQTVATELNSNEPWKQTALAEAQADWERGQRNEPDEQQHDEKAVTGLNQKIRHLVDEIEDGTGDEDIRERLSQRRRELNEVERRIKERAQQKSSPLERPDRVWLEKQIQDLHSVVSGDLPAAAIALRNLIGPVIVSEITVPGKKRKILQGVFAMNGAAVIGRPSLPDGSNSVKSREVSILFAKLPPWVALADRAKEAFDAGVRFEEIASQLGCPDHWVAKALNWWYRSRDLPVPDGRKCKSRLR